MKKLLAMLLATMLLGVGALGLAGCGETPEKTNQEEPPPDKPVLEYGFGDDVGDPQLSFRCGYVLTQTEFAKDNVFLEVYYGRMDGDGLYEWEKLQLYFFSSYLDSVEENGYLVKELHAEEFNAEAYIWQRKDSHHEAIHIPEELFVEPSGYIYFGMFSWNETIQHLSQQSSTATVRYQLTEDRVTLSVPTK